MQALLKLGGTAVKAAVEEERTQAYVRGWQRAAQGEAVAEIVDEQPWYSKLFGATNLVDGARAYTANARANAIVAGLENDMESLRKLGPDEIGRHVAGIMSKTQTGDSTTDLLVQKQLGAAVPSFLKVQAKANLKYNQERFEDSMAASHEAGFASLGAVSLAARQGGVTDGMDVLVNQLRLKDNLLPPPDMDQKHFNKILARSAVKSILGGNLDTAGFLENSGIIGSLDPSEQVTVREATARARREAQLRLPAEFADDLAQLTRAGNDGSSLESLKAKAAAFNEKYKRHTGDYQDYFSTANLATEINQWHANQDRDRERTRKAIDAADNKAAKEIAAFDHQMNIAAKMRHGSYVNDEPADVKLMAWAEVARGADPDTLARTRFVQASLGNFDKAFADKLQSQISIAAGPEFKTSDNKTPGNPLALYEAYQAYDKLVRNGSMPIAQAYAGEGARLMSAYSKLAVGQEATPDNLAIWYHRAVTESLAPRPALTDKEEKQIVKDLTESIPDWVPFRPDSFRTKNPEALARLISPFIDKTGAGDTTEAAKQQALKGRKIDGLAGWYWPLLPGVSDFRQALAKPDGNVIKVSSGEHNQAFNFAVDQYAAKVGISTVSAVGQFNDNAKGEPQVYVMGTDSNGNVKTTFMTASEVRDAWHLRNPQLPTTVKVPALDPTQRPLIKSRN
jgi:hypothetical protein